MALRGPASVLDRRQVDTTAHIVADKITRHRSPAKFLERYSYTGYDDYHLEGDLEEEILTPRVPQPYRTSFSAVVPPLKVKRDRSRSVSPSCASVSSLKSGLRSRSKSPGARRSNKHVTYDDRVVIRESGTSDSIVTNLSGRESDLNNTSGHYSATSSMLDSSMSDSGRLDYSSELRALSKQIVQEYSTPEPASSQSRVLMNNNNSTNHRQPRVATPNGTMKSHSDPDSRKQKENVHQYIGEDTRKRIVVKEDYENDRSISYRVAIQNKYSDDIKQTAADIMLEAEAQNTEQLRTPEAEIGNGNSSTMERSNSMHLENDPAIEKNKLTPGKRSISASIGNFFRRLSPHLGRKNKKGNMSAASSQSLSPSDDLDGTLDRHASSGSLSRGKLRRSFMKLVGKSPKSKKSLNKSDSECDTLNRSHRSESEQHERSVRSDTNQTPKADLYMKSIDKAVRDKEVYQKFKERQNSSKSQVGEITPSSKPQAMKASPAVVTSPEKEAEELISKTARNREEFFKSEKIKPTRTQLEVHNVPRQMEILHLEHSTVSTADSIGNCSIDPDLTGSEPSLLSEPETASKHVAVSHSFQDDIDGSHVTSPVSKPTSPTSQSPVICDYRSVDSIKPHKLYLSHPQMPIISDSTEFFPKEVVRTPSYLRISSAVSGYGHYSRYAAYKGIEKRSPYSSTLSLRSSRSDLATPLSPSEMPIGKIPNIQPPTNWPPLKNDINSPTSPVALKSPPHTVNGAKSDYSVKNGGRTVNGSSVDVDEDSSTINGATSPSVNGTLSGSENGHVQLVENFQSTGDSQKDADFFLGVAQSEEARLLLLCSRCEAELSANTISEEASGRLRAAVGKANLLINQKFRQFSDLCDKHKHPDDEGKPTKWEDLQGFWEMVKLQVDDVDEMFTEIDLIRQNGWREIKTHSRRSSASSRSSPKSGSLMNISNASTPSHTPGTRRKAGRMVKDTPDSSPERSQKARLAAKQREDNRKKLLAEKRAVMKQQKQAANEAVEIYVVDNNSKSNSPSRNGDVSEITSDVTTDVTDDVADDVIEHIEDNVADDVMVERV